MSSLDSIEQLCKVALEDVQNCFDIKEDLWKYVQDEIKLNKDLMKLIETRQGDFDWTKETPLGGAGTSLNAIVLYCLIRHFNMNYVIETGVSGGYYTSFMLSALQNSLTKSHPQLTSLELSDDMNKVGVLIPEKIKKSEIGGFLSFYWDLIVGKSSLEYFKDLKEKNIKHNASLYSHDSLHTLKHMLLELNEFKQSTSEEFYVFIDDEKSESFWDRCISMNAFNKKGYTVKHISGKESRLRGHLGGFIQYKKII